MLSRYRLLSRAALLLTIAGVFIIYRAVLPNYNKEKVLTRTSDLYSPSKAAAVPPAKLSLRLLLDNWPTRNPEINTTSIVKVSTSSPDLYSPSETAASTPKNLLTNHEEDKLTSTGPLQDWSQAVGSKEDVYVYAAYLDRRRPDIYIRLLAVVKREARHYIECSYWKSSGNLTTVVASIKPLVDHKGIFVTKFVLCPVSNYDYDDPIERVTISTIKGSSKNLTASLPVADLHNREKIGELNVCIKVMHSEFNEAAKVVEFFEMYKLLGADHFTIYNKSIGGNVAKLLRHYIDAGLLEVLPWNPPGKRDQDLFTFGEYASLNDCSLRNIGRFTLSLIIDIDEYIIPKNHDNLLQMIESQEHHGAYVFKHAFFYLGWPDDTSNPLFWGGSYSVNSSLSSEEQRHAQQLLTQAKTRRCSSYPANTVRAKYIMRPERIIQAGNHIPWEFVDGRPNENNNMLFVSPDVASVQHYRTINNVIGPDRPLMNCLSKPNTIDRIAHKFMGPLISAVTSTCHTIFPGWSSCPRS